MRVPIDASDQRSEQQIRQHYQVEKELSQILRDSSRDERRVLYAELYNQLYKSVPDHPMLTSKSSQTTKLWNVNYQMRFLRPFLYRDSTFLEIGAGDCMLSLEVAKTAKRVYAIEVSQEIVGGVEKPKNVEIIISDGLDIPVPPGSVNVVYSNQLMEHVHVDDALVQLNHIHRILRPGGVYICITPNRLNGPHDVSKYFDDVASGFHMKEYTVTELTQLVKRAGFVRVKTHLGVKVAYIALPMFVTVLCEALMCKLPRFLQARLARIYLVRLLLGIRLTAEKSLAEGKETSRFFGCGS